MILDCPYFIQFGALDKSENTAFHYPCFQSRDDITRLFAPYIIPYKKEFQDRELKPELGFRNSLEIILQSSSVWEEEEEQVRKREQQEQEIIRDVLEREILRICTKLESNCNTELS